MISHPTVRRLLELLAAPLRFWGIVTGGLAVCFIVGAYVGNVLCVKHVRSTTVTVKDLKSFRSPLSQLVYEQKNGALERVFTNPSAPEELQVAVTLDTSGSESQFLADRATYAFAIKAKDDEEKEEDEEAQRQAELERQRMYAEVGLPGGAAAGPRPFSVEAGQFNTEAEAREFVRQLRERGYAAYLETVQTEQGKVYRVPVGAFSSRTEMEALKQELDREGLSRSTSAPPSGTSPGPTPEPAPGPAEPSVSGPSPTAPTPEPAPPAEPSAPTAPTDGRDLIDI